MLQVYTAQHPSEAHIVKGVLESCGISCEVRGENLFGLRGQLPMTMETAPSVWIFDDEKYDEARIVIKEYESARFQGSSEDDPDDGDGAWKCAHCGEESDGQFTECWNCGVSR